MKYTEKKEIHPTTMKEKVKELESDISQLKEDIKSLKFKLLSEGKIW